MKIRTLVVTSCLMALSLGIARAQQPTTAEINDATKRLKAEQAAAEKIAVEKALANKAAAEAKTPAPSSARVRQPVNIKIEFTLTDQRSGGTTSKRTVSAVVADGYNGQIRSSSDVAGIGGGVTLNIDAFPEILADGKIRVGITLQYDWPAPIETPAPTQRGTVLKTVMHDNVSLILENGKPMTAAQSADPVVDRQVTVEVKATVLR